MTVTGPEREPRYRDLLTAAEQSGELVRLPGSHRPDPALTRAILEAEPAPVLVEDVRGWRVAANLLTHRDSYARALGLAPDRFLADLTRRLEQAPVWRRTDAPACQAVVQEEPDLGSIPILEHYVGDGGPFVTSAVWIVRDPELGRNLSYHRLMVTGPRSGTVRVVESRGMDRALQAGTGRREAALVFGPGPHVLLAAALSPEPEVDELELAARLAPLTVAPARTVDLEIPAEAELVIEGYFTGRRSAEGPFVDITGTRDGIREQPVFQVSAVTHRQDALYPALIPAGAEHRALMGLPKELDIARAVRRICPCRDVRMTPGSGSWLHAVVSVQASEPGHGRAVLEAAFQAHPSLKHCVVVDRDVDPADFQQVEWAVATRFQADRDLLVWPDRPSSSLDPSAQHSQGRKSRGAKMGLDATVASCGGEAESFRRVLG